MTSADRAGRLYRLADRHHYRWDNSLPPALEVDSRDTIVVECREAYGGEVTKDSTVDQVKRLGWDKVHCLTGPVAVHGAQPGDVLEVEILELVHQDWAWTGVFPGIGLLPDVFGDYALRIWTVGPDHRAELTPGVRVPVEPFCGVMGVALAEPGEHLTMPPRRTGGNIDTRHLVAGSRLYLPVEVPGALFSVGDGHLAQGDGEVCGTALETPLTVTLRFRVHRGRRIRSPQFTTARPTTSRTDGMGSYVTSCAGPDLHEGARRAVHDMILWLASEHGLDPVDAYVLCSAAGDLKISVPVLGPNHASFVTFSMPHSVFVG